MLEAAFMLTRELNGVKREAPRPDKPFGYGDESIPWLRRVGARPVHPFSFHVDLWPGFPLAKIASPSHDIAVEKGTKKRYAIDLAKGFWSLALTWQKRLQNAWSTRGHVTWNDWTWNPGPGFARSDGPTRVLGEISPPALP